MWDSVDGEEEEKASNLTQSQPKPFYHLKYSHLSRWKSYSDGETFGFTFMTMRDGTSGMPVHFIGRIDHSSPAYYSGLREFDQILQVNGTDVRNQGHKRVQHLIKGSEERISLLTGDKESVKFIMDQGFLISDKSSEFAVQFVSPALEPVWEDSDNRKGVGIRRFSLISSDSVRSSPRSARKKT